MHLSLNENEFVRFISDLHLTPDEARLETFYDFLDTLPKSCRGLFILGDFFDHWLGQDIHDTEYNKLATKLSSVGCPVMFLPGNRDFLVEDLWLKKANVKKIPDPFRVTINSQNVVLTHGDQFCTKDYFYQFFRKATRSKYTQTLFLHLPKSIRKSIFRGIRSTKNKTTKVKKFAINHSMAMTLAHASHADTLIHGHIHSPGIHIEDDFKRIVLDEWMADTNQANSISYLDIDHLILFTLFVSGKS